MRHVPFIDATGVYWLKEVIKKFSEEQTTILLSGLSAPVKEDLIRAGVHMLIDEKNMLDNVNASIKRAQELLVDKKGYNARL